MGRSISWIAIKQGRIDSVFPALRLSPLSDSQQSSTITFASVGPWLIVQKDRHGYASSLTSERFAALLSAQTTVVRWGVEEHVMCAYAQEWCDGRMVWTIDYDGSVNGPAQMNASGELPESYPKISKELLGKQAAEGGQEAEVDYVFAGVELVVKTVVGYHDDDYDGVSWGAAERESLWRRLFLKTHKPSRS